MIRAIIVDAPGTRRTAVAKALSNADILTHVCACPARHLVTALLKRSFDVVLVSSDLPGANRATWQSVVSAAQPAPVLLLLDDPQDPAILDALAKGVRGAITRRHPERSAAAVLAAIAGDVALPRATTTLLVTTMTQQDQLIFGRGLAHDLTERERQVLRLLQAGHTTGQIARDLGVAPVTVRTHISAILRKLEVDDRAEAIALMTGISTS